MKADDNLKHTEIDWQEVFDAVPDMLMILDADQRIIRVNNAMAMRFGYSCEEIIGRYCYEIVHDACTPPENCPHVKTLLSEKEEFSEILEKRLGGMFDVTTTPLFDDEGNMKGCVHVARDITAKRKKETLLKESLEIGEYALSHSLDELLTKTVDKSEFLTGSAIGFIHFLEEDEKTIHLQTWSTNTLKSYCTTKESPAHYPVDQAGVWIDCILERRPLIHNDYGRLEHRKGYPKGHPAIIRMLTVPILRGDIVVAIVGVGNKPADYDEGDMEVVSQLANLAWEYIVSKRFEEALHKSEQYAHALLNAVPDLMFRINREGVYLDYKARKEDLHYQWSSIIGKNNRDVTPPEFADMVMEMIHETLESGEMVVFEYQLDVPERGLRLFEARMAPSGPDEVTVISRDITEMKANERSLKKKIEELEWINHTMIDRELKMIELKQEINDFLVRSGQPEKYSIHP